MIVITYISWASYKICHKRRKPPRHGYILMYLQIRYSQRSLILNDLNAAVNRFAFLQNSRNARVSFFVHLRIMYLYPLSVSLISTARANHKSPHLVNIACAVVIPGRGIVFRPRLTTRQTIVSLFLSGAHYRSFVAFLGRDCSFTKILPCPAFHPKDSDSAEASSSSTSNVRREIAGKSPAAAAHLTACGSLYDHQQGCHCPCLIIGTTVRAHRCRTSGYLLGR